MADVSVNEFNLERWALVEEDEDVSYAMGNDAFAELQQSYTEPIEAVACQDVLDNNEIVTKEIGSLMEITKVFEEAQLYVDSVGVQAASYAVHRAKRALFKSFHEQNKRNKTQSLIVEFFQGSLESSKGLHTIHFQHHTLLISHFLGTWQGGTISRGGYRISNLLQAWLLLRGIMHAVVWTFWRRMRMLERVVF